MGGKVGRDSGVRKSATGGGGGGGTNKTERERETETQTQTQTQTDTQRGRETQRQRQQDTHTQRQRDKLRDRGRQRGGSGKQTNGVTRLTPQDSGSAKSGDVTKGKLHKHSVRCRPSLFYNTHKYLFLLAKPALDGKMVGKGDSFPITEEILTEKFSCNNSITIFFFGVGGRGGLSAKLPKFVKLP